MNPEYLGPSILNDPARCGKNTRHRPPPGNPGAPTLTLPTSSPNGKPPDPNAKAGASTAPGETDARIVRVVDFERALSHLSEEHQSILLLTYREHRDRRQVSDATGVSVRALTYKLPAARQALASILDRLDLL